MSKTKRGTFHLTDHNDIFGSGETQYVYIRYSKYANGNPYTEEPNENTKYIGIVSTTESTVPAYTEFQWSKYVGEDGATGEDATTVFIESVNGNIFKNANMATTLVVTVITGGQQIVSLAQLKTRYGEDARLQWSEKKYGELNFTPLSDGDVRLASDNFMLNISANDVDTKSTFRCDLLI